MSRLKEVQVWVGFSDDKPHVQSCMGNGREYSVYAKRSDARRQYEDARPAMLVFHIPSMTKKKAKRK